MTKLGKLGKRESVFFLTISRQTIFCQAKLRQVGVGGRAGQGVAALQPLDQIAVAAAGGAEWRELLDPRFAADRALSGGCLIHADTVWT